MTTQKGVEIECQVEYAVGISVFALRLLGRVLHQGVRGLRWEDFFTIVSIAIWTVNIALVHYIGVYGTSVGQTDASVSILDDDEVERIRLGDKLIFASWVCYICLTWSMKGIALFLHSRLAAGVWQDRLGLGIRWGTLMTFSAALIFQLAFCTPLELAWQVKPSPSDNCVFRRENYIVYLVLSVVSELGILAIPLSLFWRLRIPPRKKFFLVSLFGSGIFTVIATLLRTVFSLQSQLDLRIPTQWSSREYVVTTFVVSAPAVLPLFDRRLWEAQRFSTQLSVFRPNKAVLSPREGSETSSTCVSIEKRNYVGDMQSPISENTLGILSRDLSVRSDNPKLRLPSELSDARFERCSDEEAGYVTELPKVKEEWSTNPSTVDFDESGVEPQTPKAIL